MSVQSKTLEALHGGTAGVVRHADDSDTPARALGPRVLLSAADAAARRRLMELPVEAVMDLATPWVVGDPLVQVAAATLGDRFVDRYAAARMLGEDLG